MDIQFLYFEDCPSHDKALERLKQVMREEGIEQDVKVTPVETDADAEKWQFTGSPSIRIGGKDIDPLPEGTPYRLSCRIYRLEDGRVSPVPSVNMIRSALRNLFPTA